MADEDWETQAEEGAAGRVKVGVWVTWGQASLEPHGPAVLWPLCAPSTLWALSAMLLLAMSAPASCALCHPPLWTSHSSRVWAGRAGLQAFYFLSIGRMCRDGLVMSAVDTGKRRELCVPLTCYLGLIHFSETRLAMTGKR